VNSSSGTSPAHEIVPARAQAGAVFVILLAMGSAFGAAVLIIASCMAMVMSLVIDPPEHLGLAFSAFLTLSSLTLHLRGEHRRVAAILFAVVAPLALTWLVATVPEAAGGLFFLAFVLHGLVALTTALSAHATRLDSPKYWFDRRIGQGLCPRCFYEIRGLPSPRCPECGFDFSESPAD
jgi:hypothetical protein